MGRSGGASGGMCEEWTDRVSGWSRYVSSVNSVSHVVKTAKTPYYRATRPHVNGNWPGIKDSSKT